MTTVHFLHPVVDVSAQDSCTVTPLNPITLTATGGALPIGAMNVMIQCNCTNDNGTVVDPIRWYDTAGTRLVSSDHIQFNANVPHFTRVDDGYTHAILVIPTLNDSYDGTYTCGKKVKKGLPPGQPNATVNLTIESELTIDSVSNLCSTVAMYYVSIINMMIYAHTIDYYWKAYSTPLIITDFTS